MSYFNKVNYIEAVLTDIDSQPVSNVEVSLDVAGMAKTLTTDGNGKVILYLPKLKPAAYTLKATFGGNSDYAPSENSKTFNVLKAKPVLKAKKKNI